MRAKLLLKVQILIINKIILVMHLKHKILMSYYNKKIVNNDIILMINLHFYFNYVK